MRIYQPQHTPLHTVSSTPTAQRFKSKLSTTHKSYKARLSNTEGTPPTDYSRSYRSPLLSPGWQSDEEEEEEDSDSIEGVGCINDKKEGRDDVSELPEWGTLQYSQRMLRSSNKSISHNNSSKRLGIAKRPVKKVLSALPNLSSLRSPRSSGSGCAAAYLKSINSSSDYYEEETDCRDDDSEYLLGGMYDNLSGRQRDFPSSSSLVDDDEEVGEGVGGMKSFKQLREVFERGGSGSGEDERVGRKFLEVVDFGGFDDSVEEDCSDVVLDVEEERDEYNDHDEEVVVLTLSDKENDATDVIVESPRNMMKPMRKSTDDSLVGLNLSENSRPNKEVVKSIEDNSSDLCVSTSSSGGVVAEQQQQLQQPMIVNNSTDYRNQNSSFFGYSTCTEDEEIDIMSVGSSGSSSTCDMDSHLTEPLSDDKSLLLGVSKLSPVKEHATPATEAETPDVETSDSGDSDPHQSHVTYASYMNIVKRESPPVTVTPSENGDVILVTPMNDVMDIGLQPPGIKFVDQQDQEAALAPPPVPRTKTILADVRPSPALLIPSLGKHEEEDEASLECEPLVAAQDVESTKQVISSSTEEDVQETPVKMENVVSKSTPPSNEASPTGVDELEDEEAFVSDEDEQFTEVDFATPATPDERSLSPIPAVALESAFVASKGWDDDEEGADDSESVVDDATSQTSSGFGPFVKYEDALSDILKGRAKAEMIELRPSLESDCGQSSSCVSSSVVSSSVAQASDATDEQLEVVEEEEEDLSPNLLDMAVDSEELSSDDSKDAAETPPTVNEPGSFSQIYNRSFDKEENEESDSESEAPESDYYLSADSGETSDYIDQRTTTRPWAKAMNSYDSGEYESDLISAPSASMEEGDQGSPQSVPHIISGKVSDESIEEGESNNNTSLNTFWAHELEKELSHSVEEDDTEESSQARNKSIDDNIHTDCDGNQYLKVYDLDSGEDIYEVIDQRHSLETVEECRTEEEEEEEEADGDEDAVLAKEDVTEESQAKRELEVIDNVARAMEETLELDSRHKSEKSIVSLEDLHSLFDQYSEVIPESLTEEIVEEINDEQLQLSTPPPSEEEDDVALSKQSNVEVRSVRSLKKRHVHIKKRAIIKKANAMQKTKYDLAYLEKGSHHENKVSNKNKTDNIELVRVDSQDSHPSLLTKSSLDEMVSKALGVLSSREKDVEDQVDESSISSYSIISGVADVTPTVDEESSVESVTPEEYQDKCFVSYESTMKKNKEEIELLEAELNESIKSMKSKGSDNSTTQSSLSIDTFSSEEKSHEGDIVSELPVRGELKRGQSFIVAKLMDENHELAESLATTQSKLQKVKRKLERVTSERDRMISSARFEI